MPQMARTFDKGLCPFLCFVPFLFRFLVPSPHFRDEIFFYITSQTRFFHEFSLYNVEQMNIGPFDITIIINFDSFFS